MATPFTIGRSVTIEGGYLKEPWIADVKLVEGCEFVMMNSECRKFARAMGRDVNARFPWENNGFFVHLQGLRDDLVDGMIIKYLNDADSMRDIAITSLPSRPSRAVLFSEAKIPEIITVESPAFTLVNGERYAARTLKVISTPRRGFKVTVALDTSFLDWCIAASWQFDGTAAKRQRKADLPDDLPKLTEPCKYRLTPKLAVQCKYRTEQGTWKWHMQTPGTPSDDAVQTSLIREAEAAVRAFYDENHVHAQDS